MRGPGRYPKEFKLEAIRLMDSGEKPISQIAIDLGVKRTLLYRWKDQSREKGDIAFSGRLGRPKNEDLCEIGRLKKELKEVTEERDILKKAAAYFAKDLR